MGCCHSKSMFKKRNSGLFISESGQGRSHGGSAGDYQDLLRNPKIRAFMSRSLLRNELFTEEVNLRHITPEDMEMILDCFKIKDFEPGEHLYDKDDIPSDYLYISRLGLFKGMDEMEIAVILREGDLIGEIEFFHDCSRQLTVVAEGHNCSAFCLSKRDFKSIVEKGRDLNNIKILNSLTTDQKYLLKDGMSISNHLRGETILCEGEPIDAFYIVLSGLVRVINTMYKQSTYYNNDFYMYPGGYFGEENFLLSFAVSSRTFIALKDVTLCCISKDLFNNSGIFKPAVDQIKIDVDIRLNQNRLLQEEESLNQSVTSPAHSKEIRYLMKKQKKTKTVLWKKGTDDSDSEEERTRTTTAYQVKSMVMTLPVCACGLF